jgi:hypothetical protein
MKWPLPGFMDVHVWCPTLFSSDYCFKGAHSSKGCMA